MYNALYGTPAEPILDAFRNGNLPVLDWPVQQMEAMRARFPGRTFGVYLEPQSVESLRQRLASDGFRDEVRSMAAEIEYGRLLRGDFNESYDYRIVNREGAALETAISIYRSYLESLNKQKDFKLPVAKTDEEADGIHLRLTQSELDMEIKMKKDAYRRVRGGKAVMLDVCCSKCNTKVLWYQKDGVGSLQRCYLNRIFAPKEMEKLQKDPNIKEPKDMPNLVCPSCNTVLGSPMRHSDGQAGIQAEAGLCVQEKEQGHRLLNQVMPTPALSWRYASRRDTLIEISQKSTIINPTTIEQ